MNKIYKLSRLKIAQEYDHLISIHKGSTKSLRTYDIKKALKKYNIVTKYYSKTTKVLDVGCGTGNLIKYLMANKSINPKNYQGIDFSSKMINYCKLKFPKFKFDNSDLLETDKNNKFYFNKKYKFDLLVCLSTIQQKPRNINTKYYIDNNLKNFYEITKKNGIIIFDIFYDKNIDFKSKDLNYININELHSICSKYTNSLVLDFSVSPYEVVVIIKKDK